ncbi:IclR family transcriptional regulator [Deltaproteobacteria bacterium]|nr:IclR family transcriptional regulator [Deltaproteobacteria bacterium]
MNLYKKQTPDNDAGQSNNAPASAPNGIHQNIERAALILDALASADNVGLRLTDVMLNTGLKKTVVHRALNGLVLNGLANYESRSARYFLGDRLFAWTTRARARFALVGRVQPHLQALADDLQDTSYFSIIRGDESICFGRAEGTFPVRMTSLQVGDRRPLGVGSASLVIAALQPDEVVERLIAAHSPERLRYGVSDETLRRNIRITRDNGYAVHEGLFAKALMGVAVPVYNESGRCVAAISNSAINSRLEPPRLESVVHRLREEAALIQEKLAAFLSEL